MALEAKTLPNLTVREASRKFIYGGSTKKIECKNYWDSHGKLLACALTQHKFDTEKAFEIWEVTREYVYPDVTYTLSPQWELYMDGKRFDLEDLDIVSYDHLKTKLKLEVITGCG